MSRLSFFLFIFFLLTLEGRSDSQQLLQKKKESSAFSKIMNHFDLNQCHRRCRDTFGHEALGERLSSEECLCYLGEKQKEKRIPRLNPKDPPQLSKEVCSKDGHTYPTQEDAKKAGAAILHGGGLWAVFERSRYYGLS